MARKTWYVGYFLVRIVEKLVVSSGALLVINNKKVYEV